MSIKVSIVATNYSETSFDFSEMANDLFQKDIDLEVIYVYDSIEKEHHPKFSGKCVRHVMTNRSYGYYKSLRFGLMQTTGNYIYFLAHDSTIKDSNFIQMACNLYAKDADLVFGRSEITSVHGQYVLQHPFKDEYSPAEFLEEWQNLRMVFVDYFGFSSILFKKEHLMKAEAFISQFPDAFSLDTATLLKCVLLSEKISFCESVACARRGPDQILNGTDKSDITSQVINQFAIPLDVYSFINKNNLAEGLTNQIKTFFNQHAIYAFNAILSDYSQLSNEWIFETVCEKNDLKDKNVYLYGHGWVGLALNKYLLTNGISIKSFIDDFKTGEDTISLEQFKQNTPDNCVVIIANYKCSDAFRIYKKLNTIKDIKIIDLIQY